MEVLPVNIVTLVAVVLGCMMVLIPVAGMTVRYAIKPITQALMKVNAGRQDRDAVQMLERRLSLLEQEVHGMADLRRELTRVVEDLRFRSELSRPEQTPQLPGSES